MRCGFKDGLRFSTPSCGGWNLAHICRLVPQSHALFAVPPGCSRIIMLSALDKGMEGRFSALSITEEDIINGGVEDIIARGAAEALDILARRGQRPAVFMIFTSCVDGFIGADHSVYMEALREKYPDIRFLDCRMDPINRLDGVPPIVRMQSNMASLFKKSGRERAVNFLGGFLPPPAGQELAEHLAAHGYKALHPYCCSTLKELEDMGNSALNVAVNPTALPAVKALSERLGQPWAAVTGDDPFSSASAAYGEVCRLLGIPEPDTKKLAQSASEELRALAAALPGRRLALDDGAFACPVIPAAALARHGFEIKYIFCGGGADCGSAPDLPPGAEMAQLDAPSVYAARSTGKYFDETLLAIGESAAYLTNTERYASPLALGGDFGFSRLLSAARALEEAARKPRPLADMLQCGGGCAAP